MKRINGTITQMDTTAALDTDDTALVPDNGTAAPATTPLFIGQMYVDTNAKKFYVAMGTASSSDWIILN